MYVERAAEDVGEAEGVVDLVRVIRAAGGHDEIGPDRVRELGADLRVGVGEREHDRTIGHGAHHVGCNQIGGRHADEHIGAMHGVVERAMAGLLRITTLVDIEIVAVGADHALAVEQQNIVAARAEREQQLDGGEPGGAGAEQGDARVGQFLFLQFERVDQAGADDDGGAVLVVVEHRDVEACAQHLLDGETVGRGDVLEVDAAEGRGDVGHRVDEGIAVRRVHFDVEYIDAGEVLEQHGLAFQHRFRGQRAAVAEAEDGAAVADYRHQVALVGVAVGGVGVARDFAHRFGNAR
ncbi:MAG: hypothetical protein A2140_00540 [Candidatus Muproteobacteria bacterium RBG_16_62_13]|uniref:Uncharacterized protein n=1 Tax=Candidatus Muproteobacteria bacterium RBG_16_62_13 TaxID=1817756 RepID=A0A1F6T6Y7_9PROT|nr:MAG: hypothetical protein A2140_00540 [Candidatus Muproteobacteria bacterium RBG_16_62_13]